MKDRRLFAFAILAVLTAVLGVAVAPPVAAASPTCCMAEASPADAPDCNGAPCCRVTAPGPRKALCSASAPVLRAPTATVLSFPAPDRASIPEAAAEVVPHARSAPLFLTLSVIRV
ncbi:MAG TPA: hypothetical protein VGR00_03315 [Thermoanaerobaculia bacterium]|nr:hypothetical protein [Thermoanaerobaculia bacterium]